MNKYIISEVLILPSLLGINGFILNDKTLYTLSILKLISFILILISVISYAVAKHKINIKKIDFENISEVSKNKYENYILKQIKLEKDKSITGNVRYKILNMKENEKNELICKYSEYEVIKDNIIGIYKLKNKDGSKEIKLGNIEKLSINYDILVGKQLNTLGYVRTDDGFVHIADLSIINEEFPPTTEMFKKQFEEEYTIDVGTEETSIDFNSFCKTKNFFNTSLIDAIYRNKDSFYQWKEKKIISSATIRPASAMKRALPVSLAYESIWDRLSKAFAFGANLVENATNSVEETMRETLLSRATQAYMILSEGIQNNEEELKNAWNELGKFNFFACDIYENITDDSKTLNSSQFTIKNIFFGYIYLFISLIIFIIGFCIFIPCFIASLIILSKLKK